MSPHGPIYLRTLTPEPDKTQGMTSPSLLRSVSDWTRICQRSAGSEPPRGLEDGPISLDRQDPDIIPFPAR